MIYLGADKHGLEAIKFVEGFLKSKEIPFVNVGVENSEQNLPLVELIPRVTNEVLKDKKNIGILSCGTGVGVEVGANKLSGIRACLVTEEKMAEYARMYDDCNILCLAGWELQKENTEKILSKLDRDWETSSNT